MIIVGAGLAGLIAANLLSRYNPVIIEKQSSLPNNHHAVLRFKTLHLSDALHIPFRSGILIKNTLPWNNPVADALAYAHKVTGESRSDRSITKPPPKEEKDNERYIAPPDFIEQLSKSVNIIFNKEFDPLRNDERPPPGCNGRGA